jgi:DNA mismatch endonuclease (patch repair protein)
MRSKPRKRVPREETTSHPSWASTPGVRNRMQLQPSFETQPELLLRRALHTRGLRYRTHRRILPGRSRTVDIVFGPSKVAVLVDGCFWHGCPEHYRIPRTNEAYWRPKIEGNRSRDKETSELLQAKGWLVIRVWEHEDTEDAADRVELAVRQRRRAALEGHDRRA